MVVALVMLSSVAGAQARRAGVRAAEPAGPVVVMDTSAGRIVCRLYAKEAPKTVANFIALVQGTKDWTGADGSAQHGKPFYDGLQIFGATDSILAGDRALVGQGTAGEPGPVEATGLTFDRPGRLAALVAGGKQSASAFTVSRHADMEMAKRGVVFGQCDEASTQVADRISHELLSTDNHPEHPVVLRQVRIVEAGAALPPEAQPAPNEATLRVPPAPVSPVPVPEPTGPTATIETSMGTLTCRLFSKEAPLGVANFIGLATGKKEYRSPATHAMVRGKLFYNGLGFRRVIPDFMVQQSEMPADPDGGSDLGFHFANEIVPGLTFDRPGRLAYANAGPNTNSSEWFVTEHPVHRLDGNFTIFGQCDDASVKVVEAMARVARDEHNRPLKAVTILRVTIAE